MDTFHFSQVFGEFFFVSVRCTIVVITAAYIRYFFGIIAISSTFVPTAVVDYCSHCCSYHCWRHRDNISHCQIETLQLMSDYHKLLLLQVNYTSSELKHATKIYCILYATWSAITKTYTKWTASKIVWHVNLLGIIFVISRASSAAKLLVWKKALYYAISLLNLAEKIHAK